MRALPFFLIASLITLGPLPATGAKSPDAAASLLPLVSALGGRPTSALLEVYADGVEAPPAVSHLEDELLTGAQWTHSALGAGVRYAARLGGRSAEIVELPLTRSRVWLLCTLSDRVAPAMLGPTLQSLRVPPCGTGGRYVAVTADVTRKIGRLNALAALRLVGVQHPTVIAGSAGVFALGLLAGARPVVQVGGVPMNLALRVSYIKAHDGQLTVATPTLSGVGPW